MRYIYGPNAEDVKDIPTAKIVAITTILFTVPILISALPPYLLFGKETGIVGTLPFAAIGLLFGVYLAYSYAKNQTGKVRASKFVKEHLKDLAMSLEDNALRVYAPNAKIYSRGVVTMDMYEYYVRDTKARVYRWYYEPIEPTTDQHTAKLPTVVRLTQYESIIPAIDLGDYVVAIVPPSDWFRLDIGQPIRIAHGNDKLEVLPVNKALEIHYVKNKSRGARLEGVYSTNTVYSSGTVKIWETDSIPFIQQVFHPGDVKEMTLIVFPHKMPLATYKGMDGLLLWAKITGKKPYVTDISVLRATLDLPLEKDVHAEVPAEFVSTSDSKQMSTDVSTLSKEDIGEESR